MGKNKKSFGEAVAVGSALAGAALGAAAVFLSDKKNQEKIKKTVDDVSEEAVKIGKTVKKKVEEMTKNSKKATVKKTIPVTKKAPEKEEEKTGTPDKKD